MAGRLGWESLGMYVGGDKRDESVEMHPVKGKSNLLRIYCIVLHDQ